MLQPAHVGHLSILRSLIRDGASRGSFDRELATDSSEAALFFSNLRQALNTGYFVEEDPRTGDLTTVAVPGYVYLPDRGGAANQPIGFGLFKAIDLGFELWLTGVDAEWRGHGHGRAMLTALLATPPGKRAYIVRVHRFGRDSPAMAHLAVVVRLCAGAGNPRSCAVPAHRFAARTRAPPARLDSAAKQRVDRPRAVRPAALRAGASASRGVIA